MSQHVGQLFLEEASRYKPDLPYPPSLLRDLFSMTREDSLATVDDITEVVARDQGLTTKILALANSAFYGLQAKVASLSRGISLLGIKEIRSLVLLLGVQSLTRNVSMPSGFDLRSYWAHQLSTAVVCRLLAGELPARDSDERKGGSDPGQMDPDILFTCGLLHDFGKLVAALHRPNDMEAILDMAREQHMTQASAEEDYWGVEHGLVGGMVLGAWDLPPELTEPITWHHAPSLSPDNAREATVLALANALVHRHDDPESPSAQGWQDHLARLGLDEEDMLRKVEQVLSDENLFHFLTVLD